MLTKHLTRFAEVCSATEVILFERTTFLVIATSDLQQPVLPPSETGEVLVGSPEALHALHGARYERTSELIKSLKHACARLREEFAGLEFELPECTAVLAEMTRNTYVLVIAHDRNIGTVLVICRVSFTHLYEQKRPLSRSTYDSQGRSSKSCRPILSLADERG